MAANPRTAARKATARTQSRRTVEEPDVTPAEAQEIEAEGHYVTANLAGEDLRIIPPGAWRQSWQIALANGQFVYFAQQVMHPDDFDLYMEIDPTNDEFEEFIAEAARRAGESLGKSHGPAGSSRRTQRR
jgi:hypothetical protein